MDYFVITMCLMFVGVVANIDWLKHYVDNKALSVVIVYLSFYIFKRNILIGNLMFIVFAAATFRWEWKDLRAMLRFEYRNEHD
jgi:hypothetical protein